MTRLALVGTLVLGIAGPAAADKAAAPAAAAPAKAAAAAPAKAGAPAAAKAGAPAAPAKAAAAAPAKAGAPAAKAGAPAAKAGAPAAAATAPAEAAAQENSCAAMMTALLPLPTKFEELMTSVSEGMAGHAAWVGAKGAKKEARAEAMALRKLSADHRAVANQMKKIIKDMEAGAKLPAAPHDMSKMDPKMGENMAKQAALQREMAALMIKNAESIEKKLAEMAKATPAATN